MFSALAHPPARLTERLAHALASFNYRHTLSGSSALAQASSGCLRWAARFSFAEAAWGLPAR